LKDRPALREGVRDADCVLACTDTQRSRAVINEETVAFRTPTIYAGAFERAYGGNVVRYDPLASGEQPCHACIHGPPEQMEDTPRNPDGSFDYSAAEDAESSEFAAEPGLSADVGFIALLQTRYALATLARNTDRDATDIPYDIIRWGNRARNEFDAPFQRDWIGIEPDEECPVCGPDGVAEQLRTSVADVGLRHVDPELR
jgi:molybdopterin/thiamine biosynthesis adenylyltransferase